MGWTIQYKLESAKKDNVFNETSIQQFSHSIMFLKLTYKFDFAKFNLLNILSDF